MHTFDDFELARTDEDISINTREENCLAITKMAQQCRKSIEIISHNLNPEIYDTVEFVEATKRMILDNRHTKVRILVFQTQSIVKKGHRLVDLAKDLSSFIEFRVPGEEFRSFNEALFIADSIGYIHRFNAERFEGMVNFNDLRVSKYLRQHFERMWDRSETDVNFRKLSI